MVVDIVTRVEASPNVRVIRYRRMPALSEEAAGWGVISDTGREKRCDRNGGHVLTVLDGQIVCTVCPAVWKDEGF